MFWVGLSIGFALSTIGIFVILVLIGGTRDEYPETDDSHRP